MYPAQGALSYPQTKENRLMPQIVLTDHHVSDDHPDYPYLTAWLIANDVDLLWICIPSTIDIVGDEIRTLEYGHVGDQVQFDDKMQVVRKQSTYQLKQRILPPLTHTEIRP